MSTAVPVFSLPYREVERLLVELHSVHDSRKSALRARLKHFKRLGFPAGVNTGTGKAVAYDALSVFQIVLAFELLALGLTPERSIFIIRGFAHVTLATAGLAAALYRPKSAEIEGDILFCFDPAVLDKFAIAADAPDDGVSDEYSAGDVWWRATGIPDDQAARRRQAVVNVSALLFAVDNSLATPERPTPMTTAIRAAVGDERTGDDRDPQA